MKDKLLAEIDKANSAAEKQIEQIKDAVARLQAAIFASCPDTTETKEFGKFVSLIETAAEHESLKARLKAYVTELRDRSRIAPADEFERGYACGENTIAARLEREFLK